MTICAICKNDFNPRNGRHIYFCAKTYGLELSQDEIRCQQIMHEHPDLTKADFIYLHTNEEWSLPDFASHYRLQYQQTQFLVRHFGLTKRGHSEAKRTARFQEKFQNTSMKNYGVPNPSSNAIVNERRVETVQKRFGVDNVRKSAWFRIWYDHHMQTTYGKGSLPNRYGGMQAYWDSKTTEEKRILCKPWSQGYLDWYQGLNDEQKIAHNILKANNITKFSSSSIEEAIGSVMLSLDMPFQRQVWIAQKSYDFLIFDTIVIEVQGDYWHANPTKYQATDIITYPDRNITAAERWEEDVEKKVLAEKYGYTVLTLWESDIKSVENLDKWFVERLTCHVDENKIDTQNRERFKEV